ncbi:MAG: hypothetical protein NC930_07415 [Candidatus Omnitrophica bacterium]|nr:hypothetical protein [Candidatus Omnitrophota bacterium]
MIFLATSFWMATPSEGFNHDSSDAKLPVDIATIVPQASANDNSASEDTVRLSGDSSENIGPAQTQNSSNPVKQVSDIAKPASSDKSSQIATPFANLAKALVAGTEEDRAARADSLRRLAEALSRLAENQLQGEKAE